MSETTTPTRLLLTPREAAQTLSICEKTLYNMAKNGQLHPIRIGRAIRYSLAELQAFVVRRGPSDHHTKEI